MASTNTGTIAATKKWAGIVVGQFVSVVLASTAMLAYTKQEREEEELAKNKRDVAKFGFELDKEHRKHSQCIEVITRFKKRVEENTKEKVPYDEVFKQGMDGPVKQRSDEIVEINKCRSITKGYWRMVDKYLSAYSGFVDQDEIEEMKKKHSRFVELVKPLDILDGYTDQEKLVYKMFKHD